MAQNLLKLLGIALICPGLCLQSLAQVSGSGRQSGSGSIWTTAAVNPLPTASITASNTTPTQGGTITLTYTSSGATNCNINQGILSNTTTCNGTTASFVPPFVAPGPTSTTYTFTVFNGSGQVGVNVTVVVAAAVVSGDDSIYSTGINELCSYPGGVTTDGPATLPQVCNDTKLADTVGSGTIRTVGYSGGVLTPGTCTSDWLSVIALVAAGDTIKIAQGCVITCGSSTGCLLSSPGVPVIHGDWTHWTKIISVDPATGNPDVGFPAEGKRATPCDIGLASVPFYPDYSVDCTARGGPKNRMFKMLSPSATTPALAVFDSNIGAIPCSVTNYPCTSYWRIQGMEATNLNSTTRTSHKLVEFAGADHMIFDRGVLHSLNDPLFRVEVQGGVNINGSHLSVINSYIYDIVCANAPTGSTCIDSQAVGGGVNNFPQVGHKIVNNLGAASGETWFWGGASSGYYPTVANPDGNASDIEVRRNHAFKPLSWFLPYQTGPFTLTSVDNAGNFTGVIFGGTNNALVGRTFKTSGFVNTANNLSVRLVTASTNTTISFAGSATVAETHAATATNSEPHWDPKNNGETKASNRSLWEANVCENSWQGFQSDQFGNCWLNTPKNQNSKLAIPAGDVLTGVNIAGLHYMNCTNGAGTCSAASKPLFTCELDPNAVPDWSGNGTTVASCGSVVAFSCVGGTSQASCPGSYQKLCESVGDSTHCAVTIGNIFTGPFYHILAVVSADQVQVLEDATAQVAVTPIIYKRALNPFASVRNHTVRYSIGRHAADGFENSTGQDDGGSDARGVHNVSLHDLMFYDINPGFWSNASTCCNSGWFVKVLSGTPIAAYVPSDLQIIHNTAPIIGYTSSHVSGLTAIFDQRCKTPIAGPTCSGGTVPAYMPRMTIRDNISSASVNLINGSSVFTNNTVAFGAGFYGCSGHDGITGCDYNFQKNLVPTNLWSGQTNQTPNLNLLGANTVEACSCTTAANGGSCTPGSPPTWSTPVVSASLDACDRNPASGFGSIFNNWDPTGGPNIDLQLPSNSPYKATASDGGDFGANIPLISIKTAGVAGVVPITQIAINGFVGNTACNDITPCALPNATHGVAYSQTLSRTTPNGPYTQWTQTAGTLPAGMQLVLGTGVIWGTPTVAGNYSFSFKAEDGAHSTDLQAYTLTVN